MRRNVILDLDNTILCSEVQSDFPFDDPAIEDKAVKFDFHDLDGYYIVFERPHVQDFLDHLFANYNVSVWTAATKDYALFIIDRILLRGRGSEERRLDQVLFSYHCDISRKIYDSPKQLQLIFDLFEIPDYTEDNTVIIDDLDLVYNAQPELVIPVIPFEVMREGSERDDVLYHLGKRIEDHFDRKAADRREER
jgi:TFIIF-interacting CTD phosphatase-like protein